MKGILKTIGLLLFIAIGHIAFGQNVNKQNALAKGREAIKLMDNGKVDESIKLLEEAQLLDPDKFDYPYELAYARYLKKDYKGVIKILEEHIDHKDVTDQLFQLLGNSYDLLGNSDKAFEVYDAGLQKFPNSGKLYLEKGNIHWIKKEYVKALPYYEKGIEVDPSFSSNYFRAAILYFNSTEEVRGLIYGELFMNLERNSSRTAEMSEMLYDTYKSEIKISEDSINIDFCNIVMNAEDIASKEKIGFPFCMVFGQAFIMALGDINAIDISSLDKIRTAFVKNYFKMGHNKTHPIVLYDYQNKMLELGHLEAYNHWILSKGDEEGFGKWRAANKDKWDSFLKWFSENGLEVNDTNKYYSEQY